MIDFIHFMKNHLINEFKTKVSDPVVLFSPGTDQLSLYVIYRSIAFEKHRYLKNYIRKFRDDMLPRYHDINKHVKWKPDMYIKIIIFDNNVCKTFQLFRLLNQSKYNENRPFQFLYSYLSHMRLCKSFAQQCPP